MDISYLDRMHLMTSLLCSSYSQAHCTVLRCVTSMPSKLSIEWSQWNVNCQHLPVAVTLYLYGSIWHSGQDLLKVYSRSRIRIMFTQDQMVFGSTPMTMCRNVGQTSNSMLTLPTQQWWVPGGRELWLSGWSCLHACMTCALYSPRGDDIAQVVCVVYWGR